MTGLVPPVDPQVLDRVVTSYYCQCCLAILPWAAVGAPLRASGYRRRWPERHLEVARAVRHRHRANGAVVLLGVIRIVDHAPDGIGPGRHVRRVPLADVASPVSILGHVDRYPGVPAAEPGVIHVVLVVGYTDVGITVLIVVTPSHLDDVSPKYHHVFGR